MHVTTNDEHLYRLKKLVKYQPSLIFVVYVL